MHWYTFVLIYFVGLFIIETICRITEFREDINKKRRQNSIEDLYAATILYPLVPVAVILYYILLGIGKVGSLFFRQVYLRRFVDPLKSRLFLVNKKKAWDKKNAEAFRRQSGRV